MRKSNMLELLLRPEIKSSIEVAAGSIKDPELITIMEEILPAMRELAQTLAVWGFEPPYCWEKIEAHPERAEIEKALGELAPQMEVMIKHGPKILALTEKLAESNARVHADAGEKCLRLLAEIRAKKAALEALPEQVRKTPEVVELSGKLAETERKLLEIHAELGLGLKLIKGGQYG